MSEDYSLSRVAALERLKQQVDAIRSELSTKGAEVERKIMAASRPRQVRDMSPRRVTERHAGGRQGVVDSASPSRTPGPMVLPQHPGSVTAMPAESTSFTQTPRRSATPSLPSSPEAREAHLRRQLEEQQRQLETFRSQIDMQNNAMQRLVARVDSQEREVTHRKPPVPPVPQAASPPGAAGGGAAGPAPASAKLSPPIARGGQAGAREFDPSLVLAVPLDEVLMTCPAFRRNFDGCDAGRRLEIRSSWGPSCVWLYPLLRDCWQQDNFATLGFPAEGDKAVSQIPPTITVQTSRDAGPVSLGPLPGAGLSEEMALQQEAHQHHSGMLAASISPPRSNKSGLFRSPGGGGDRSSAHEASPVACSPGAAVPYPHLQQQQQQQQQPAQGNTTYISNTFISHYDAQEQQFEQQQLQQQQQQQQVIEPHQQQQQQVLEPHHHHHQQQQQYQQPGHPLSEPQSPGAQQQQQQQRNPTTTIIEQGIADEIAAQRVFPATPQQQQLLAPGTALPPAHPLPGKERFAEYLADENRELRIRCDEFRTTIRALEQQVEEWQGAAEEARAEAGALHEEVVRGDREMQRVRSNGLDLEDRFRDDRMHAERALNDALNTASANQEQLQAVSARNDELSEMLAARDARLHDVQRDMQMAEDALRRREHEIREKERHMTAQSVEIMELRARLLAATSAPAVPQAPQPQHGAHFVQQQQQQSVPVSPQGFAAHATQAAYSPHQFAPQPRLLQGDPSGVAYHGMQQQHQQQQPQPHHQPMMLPPQPQQHQQHGGVAGVPATPPHAQRSYGTRLQELIHRRRVDGTTASAP